MNCTNCGQPLPDGAEFCGFCGTRVIALETSASVVTEQSETQAAPKKKSKKPLIAVLISVAALLCAAAIVLVCFGLGLFGGPLGGLKRGVYNLVQSGGATFDIRYETKWVSPEYGYSNENSGLVITGSNKGETKESGNGRLVFDREKSSYVVLMQATSDGDEATILFDNGDTYTVNKDHAEHTESSDARDKWSESIDIAEKVLDGETVNWDKKMDDEDSVLYGMDEVVDGRGIENILSLSAKHLNDKKWLESTLGFEKKRVDGVTEYRFAFSTYDLAMAGCEIFDGNIDEDMYELYSDGVRDGEEDLDKQTHTVVFRVKGKQIIGVTYSVRSGWTAENGQEFYRSYTYDVTFTQIGKTEIDKKDIDRVIDAYDNTLCANRCGAHSRRYEGYCWSCAYDLFGYCDDCHSVLNSNGYCNYCGRESGAIDEPSDDLRPYYPEEAIPVVLDAHYLENGDVQVTLHGGLLIEGESEVLNAQQIADGFISGVRNDDRSVTYVIAGDRYDEFIANHKQRCRDAIVNAAASGVYESVYAAEPTEDFSRVKAIADTDSYSGLDGAQAVFEAGFYAIRAQAFDVNAVGQCVVEVVDETSGAVLMSRVYPDEFDLFPLED